MCDHHQLRGPPGTTGEINDVNMLSEHIGRLFLNEDYSDVTLLVEQTRFQAHKVVLAARSEYFRALLFGGMRESSPECCEIELKDTSAIAFNHLLRYIYTGRINLIEIKEETLLDVLGLTHQYGFVELESSISDYLKAVLNDNNVCLIYDIASVYGLVSLCKTCCDYIDHNAPEIIKTDAFFSLSAQALQDVICRDSFYAPEIDIFRAVQNWANRNADTLEGSTTISDIMKHVRMPLIDIADLLSSVRSSSLVCPDTILDAIKIKQERRSIDLNYRGLLLQNENVAVRQHGCQVLCGEMKSSLLDGDVSSYDQDRGFTRHPIDDNQGQGIMVELGKPSIVNTINLLLWDKDARSYSYYVEVSMDEKDWEVVVDHTKFSCRSWQYLHFKARVVKFVRVVGTHNTVNRVFHLVSLECMYTSKPFNLTDGIIEPQDNVATTSTGACVTEGVSRTRNALINGDTKHYDWDSGYTCHQLGSGAIVIQLAQPYVIDSCRLLLWDCDGRSYSYYIEVSVNGNNWMIVADKTKEACKSWQTITFKKQPVTFIKIVGTHNTANEVFHCVHFECPANRSSLTEYLSRSTNKIHRSSSMSSGMGGGGGSGAIGGGVIGGGQHGGAGVKRTGEPTMMSHPPPGPSSASSQPSTSNSTPSWPSQQQQPGGNQHRMQYAQLQPQALSPSGGEQHESNHNWCVGGDSDNNIDMSHVGGSGAGSAGCGNVAPDAPGHGECIGMNNGGARPKCGSSSGKVKKSSSASSSTSSSGAKNSAAHHNEPTNSLSHGGSINNLSSAASVSSSSNSGSTSNIPQSAAAAANNGNPSVEDLLHQLPTRSNGGGAAGGESHGAGGVSGSSGSLSSSSKREDKGGSHHGKSG